MKNRCLKIISITLFVCFVLKSETVKSSGIYTVGMGQTYPTFKSALDAVNSGVITGDLIFQVAANCSETFGGSPTLNASGSGSANYSSILIYPTGSPRTISSSGGISYLFYLNGADNVVVDGRVDQTGINEGLIFDHPSTGNYTTVLFANDANNNVIKYCTIKGSNSGISFTGVLKFGTASAGGNDNNIIDHCTITKSGSNVPRWLIVSDGTASNSNSGISITNCNISEFSRDAIWLRTNTDNWTITGNSFYGTSLLTPSSNSAFISVASGSDYTISNNYFGGQSVKCGLNTGSPFTINSSVYGFYAVLFSAGSTAGTTNTINGNTFQNISFTTTTSSVTPTIAFVASLSTVAHCNFIIGVNGNGNTIGATSGTGSIVCTDNGTTNCTFSAFYKSGGSGSLMFSYNTVGSITLLGTNVMGGFSMLVALGSGSTTFTNNVIGNSEANNLYDPNGRSSATNYLACRHTSTGIFTASDNTIRNFSFSFTGLGSGCYGFSITNASSVTISSNSFSSIVYARNGNFYPIYTSIAGDIVVNSNSLSDIILSHSGVVFTGLNLTSTGGNLTVNLNTIGGSSANNISIASNTSNRGIYTSVSLNKAVSLSGNTIQEINFTSSGSSNEAIMIYVVGTGNSTVSNSIIRNITSSSTYGGVNRYALVGIQIGTSGTTSIVFNNVIDNLAQMNATAVNAQIIGIYHKHSSASYVTNALIFKNKITNFINQANGGGNQTIYGIYSVSISGTLSVENNIVLLSNGSNTNRCIILGIADILSIPMTIYHNTVYVSGSVVSGSTTGSYPYSTQMSNNGRIIKNNIFKNTRTGGTGIHVSALLSSAGTLTMDYNYLESTNPVVSWGGSTISFASWTAIHANEKTGNISIDSDGYVTAGEIGTVKDNGTDLYSGSIVIIDYFGNIRDIEPWRGAIEPITPPIVLPIELLSFTGRQIKEVNHLEWILASEFNIDYYSLERSIDGINFELLKTVETTMPFNGISEYTYQDDSFQDIINYYQLWQTDMNGEKSSLGIITINNSKKIKEINKKYNLIGQEVNDEYQGIVILLFNDGTTATMYNK